MPARDFGLALLFGIIPSDSPFRLGAVLDLVVRRAFFGKL